MSVLLWIAIMAVLVAIWAEGMRRAPAWVWIAALTAIAVSMPISAALTGVTSPAFVLTKVYSLVVALLAFAAVRFRWIRADATWVQGGFWFILAANILEAVVAGAANGAWMNPLAGLLLIATTGWPGVRPARSGDCARTEWPFQWSWVLSYTLWNLTFTYSLVSETAPRGAWVMMTPFHLGLPLLLARRRAEWWIEARTLTLAFILPWGELLRDTEWVPLPEGLFDPRLYTFLQASSLVACGAMVALHIRHRQRVTSRVR